MPTKCSLFFGGAHNPCCEHHDMDYAKGSGVSRREADTRLLICAALLERPWRGILMFIGTRALGWIFYKGKK